MKIIVVDDERIALQGLVNTIQEAIPTADICRFRSAKEVMGFIETETFDVAFLDIDMRDVTGLELARNLKDKKPRSNIIFVTGYRDYLQQAFDIFASGYIVKPATAQNIKEQIQNLRYPIEDKDTRIKVQTFGNFEVFVDEQPVKFNYNKAKEMFAYLVDRRGTLCSNREIMAALWEGGVKDSYFQNVRHNLLNAFPSHIFIKQKGKIGIVVDAISCDYYDYLEGTLVIQGIREYMTQYSWGEATLADIIYKNK